MTTVGNVVPYTCIHIDADLKDIFDAARRCLHAKSADLDTWATRKLRDLFTTAANPNHVMPCLSVRTGFDLFCRAMEFPPGSEIIMSAINIPDMTAIARGHQLNVVPLDIHISTLAPKVELLPHLISVRTVAIVVAHLYGTRFDVAEVLKVAQQHGMFVVEDCAEAFGGFDYLGHPASDLALFSFGVIKHRTAFGGAIAKVRDAAVYERMTQLHGSYRRQTNLAYLKKLAKYAGIYFLINVPWVMRPGMVLGKLFQWDYQMSVVNWLRGFPARLLNRIRLKPATALLVTMVERLGHVSDEDHHLARLKGRYVASKLAAYVRIVGSRADMNNFWLFPILVENAGRFSRILNSLGIDSYKGATQLDVVLPAVHHQYFAPSTPNHLLAGSELGLLAGKELSSFLPSLAPSSLNGQDPDILAEFECAVQGERCAPDRGVPQCDTNDLTYPHEAKYLIDHVVYLPVHKDVPFAYLDVICDAVAMASSEMSRGSPAGPTVLLKSKL